jgi:hypothetical protein
MRALLGVTLSVGVVCSAAGATKDAIYLCVPEIAGGLGFNVVTKRWEGSSFRPGDKFIVRLKYLQSKTTSLGESDEYNVVIKQTGTSNGEECITLPASDPSVIAVNKWGWVLCTSGLSDYRINIVKNRFLKIYPLGYADGEDNEKNTPVIVGGTCTKID